MVYRSVNFIFQSVDTESDSLGIMYCSLSITVQSVDADADSIGVVYRSVNLIFQRRIVLELYIEV